jgi:catechol 2,3-dioxygenase-like lactoylglutathione lyase family enzyme
MPLQVTAIMVGVQDLARSKKFYAEGLGCKIDKDYPGFVSFDLGSGSSSLVLYEWSAAAQDAGVSPEGSGFRGGSFHYIVDSIEPYSLAAPRRVHEGAEAHNGAALRYSATPTPL